MQKPWAPAIDLADHDIVEDDGDLVVGPLAGRLSANRVSAVSLGKQLGGSSFKDNSILGSASLTAKIAMSSSVPAPSSFASRVSSAGNSVYAGGNPIIATASISRPNSGAVRKPRTSAPSGGMAPNSDIPTSVSAHGGLALDSGGEDTLGGVPSRMQGDILGGDGDGTTPQKRSGLLRRFSSSRNGTLTATKPGGADNAVLSATSSVPGGVEGGGISASNSRRSLDKPVIGNGSALPCVDVEPERRQLLRKLSITPSQAAMAVMVTVQSKTATGACPPSQGRGSGAGSACSHAQAVDASAMASCGAPTAPAAAVEQTAAPMGLLSRLKSGSLVTPAGSDAKYPDEAGASKGRSSAIGGLRELFSRPSSARRKSELGGPPQGPPPPFMAWKPQQRHSHHGQMDDPVGQDSLQDGTTGLVVGGGRQHSGLLKRTASALAAAWAR